jgi:hypothetical protein
MKPTYDRSRVKRGIYIAFALFVFAYEWNFLSYPMEQYAQRTAASQNFLLIQVHLSYTVLIFPKVELFCSIP